MSKRDVVQSHIEMLMGQILETDDLQVTPDGEIPVVYRSATYSVRVSAPPHPAPHVQVYAIAVDEVDADPGLYEALNTMNERLSYARTFWTDRKIVIAGELLGAAVEGPELECLCDEVAAVAHAEGPKLAATYGGRVAHPEHVEGDE